LSLLVLIDLQIEAAVARAPKTPFTVERVNLRDARHDEVLVRVVSTGVCHTDVAVKDRNLCAFPIVLGHGQLIPITLSSSASDCTNAHSRLPHSSHEMLGMTLRHRGYRCSGTCRFECNWVRQG
jgi:hypothetical protein